MNKRYVVGIINVLEVANIMLVTPRPPLSASGRRKTLEHVDEQVNESENTFIHHSKADIQH